MNCNLYKDKKGHEKVDSKVADLPPMKTFMCKPMHVSRVLLANLAGEQSLDTVFFLLLN